MTSPPRLLSSLTLLSTLLACGGEEAGPTVGALGSRAAFLQPSNGEHDNGTKLSATGEAGPPVCAASGVLLPVSGTVTSTGSDGDVRVLASVGGAAEVQVGLIPTEAFSHDGRIKTADYTVQVPIAEGSYSVQLCFAQDGNQGRQPKRVCLEQAYIGTAVCDTCSTVRRFGNLSNRNVCGNGPINLHVEGGFGTAAMLTIHGPSGTSRGGPMRPGDDACTWHYQWRPGEGAVAGTYGFEVTGQNGQGYSFSETLECRRPGNPH